MSGADKGKRDEHGPEAERLFVEKGLSCTAIAERLGGVVSARAVRQWCDWGGWKEQRARRKSAGTAMEKLCVQAEKDLDDLIAGRDIYSAMAPGARLDAMAKIKSIIKRDTKQIDPRRVMEIAIGVLFGLARYLGKKDPDLADALSRHMHPFLKLVRAGKVEINILPSEEETDND